MMAESSQIFGGTNRVAEQKEFSSQEAVQGSNENNFLASDSTRSSSSRPSAADISPSSCQCHLRAQKNETPRDVVTTVSLGQKLTNRRGYANKEFLRKQLNADVRPRRKMRPMTQVETRLSISINLFSSQQISKCPTGKKH